MQAALFALMQPNTLINKLPQLEQRLYELFGADIKIPEICLRDAKRRIHPSPLPLPWDCELGWLVLRASFRPLVL